MARGSWFFSSCVPHQRPIQYVLYVVNAKPIPVRKIVNIRRSSASLLSFVSLSSVLVDRFEVPGDPSLPEAASYEDFSLTIISKSCGSDVELLYKAHGSPKAMLFSGTTRLGPSALLVDLSEWRQMPPLGMNGTGRGN